MTAGGRCRCAFAGTVHQARLPPAVLTLGIKVFRRQLRRWAQRLNQVQAEVGEQLPRLDTGIFRQATQPDQAVGELFSVLAQARIYDTAQMKQKVVGTIQDGAEVEQHEHIPGLTP